MPLAEVKQLPCNNLRDTPLMLRKLADQIEAGEWGDVYQCVCAFQHEQDDVDATEVFMWGDLMPADTYFLLHKAANKVIA